MRRSSQSYYRTILIALALGLLPGLSYAQEAITENKKQCGQPLTYSIGEIDPSFSITADEVRRHSSEMIRHWERAADRPLAVYDSLNSDLTINLRWTERSEKGFKDYQLKNEMKEVYNAIRKQRLSFDYTLNRYKQRLERWEEELQRLEEMEDSYQLEPKNTLMMEINDFRRRLQREENRLRQQEKRSRDLQEGLRMLKNQSDSLLAEYDQYFDSGQKMTLGMYEKSEEGKKIIIYYFKDIQQLQAILLHEWGHALGMGHLDSQQTVMSKSVKNQLKMKTSLSVEDAEAIQMHCSANGGLAENQDLQ